MGYELHMPYIFGNPNLTVEGQEYRAAAAAFVAAWFAHLGERAALMRHDERLMQCAQQHADYLANREDMTPSLHIGRGGSTPNDRVRATGYQLPSFWTLSNNCEACAVDHDGPEQAVERLIASPAHRPLVLGERVSDWFWHRHIVWGVGNSGPFYVLVACPPEGEM